MPDIDDLTIDNETLLLRRIPTNPVCIVRDDNLGCWRPSSASFENHPDGSPMSVVLSDTLDELDRPYTSALGDHGEDFSLASFKAGLARECNQGVMRKPTEEEPAHGEVFGNKSKSVRKKLAKNASWIVPPYDESL